MLKSFSQMRKVFIFLPMALIASDISIFAEESQAKAEHISKKEATQIAAFTGRVLGNHVRLRTSPDLEGHVVKELSKNDLLIIVGEKDEFYAVEPTSDVKAYVFRSFVLDNVVEGNRVNVRLHPDLEAPVINHLSTGKRIDGKICEKNNKWLEIDAPAGTKFFIAKEYIEHAGGPELKAVMDKRKATAVQLFESASLLTQAELRKPFDEMARDRVIKGYQTIISDYKDFPELVDKAKDSLVAFNEKYLERKISFLEAKASNVATSSMSLESVDLSDSSETYSNTELLTDRMKIWEPVEESLYLAWAAMHRAKSMDDFYADQRLKSITVSGILEAYADPVKNKPGDYVLKEKDLPVGYVYSTHVNLQSLVGKRVNLVAIARPNNSFAFPAYYVLDAE